MDSTPLVSVVIPTLNAGERFPKLLAALNDQQMPGGVEVVVIDSASTDGTPERAQGAGAQVLSIPRSAFNHGRSRNDAIRATHGEYIALTVQDALPADDQWLARLVEPLQELETVAGSYGLQQAPPEAGLLARARSESWAQSNDRALIKSVETWGMAPRERWALIRFDNVTSCIRRNVWERIPFPERDYAEDVAWAKRVLQSGFQLAYVPSARVWHCHERGWLYELRRGYVEGFARHHLVGWTTTALGLRDVVTLGRRLLFFLTTHRFDSMVDAVEIQSFLGGEVHHYQSLPASPPTQVYVTALKFAWGLTESAFKLLPEPRFPPGTWADLLRFALVAVVGESLGSSAVLELEQPFSPERVIWRGIDRFLGEGI